MAAGGEQATTNNMSATDLEAKKQGLTSEQAAALLKEFGRNEIPEEKVSPLIMFLAQFWGLMPFMIEVAAVLAIIAKDWTSFGIILAMLVLNAGIGFHEEHKAAESINALQSSMVSKVGAKRDGKVVSVDTAEIVPGDVIFLRGGQVVPADGTWVGGDKVSVDTSALTGEPFPRKVPNDGGEGGILGGCVIKEGECYFLVEKTGVNTEIGNAAVLIQDASSGSTVGFFEKKILDFVKIVILVTVLLVVIVVIVELVSYSDTEAEVLLSALTIIIAAVPIALPVVMKITQALGAVEMSKENAIVTHLTALQEIASMTVLCSDKTGTLTTAEITVFPEKIFARPGFTQEEILAYAALASNPDNLEDPIDIAVLRSFRSFFGEQRAESIRTEQWGIERNIGFNATTKRSMAMATRKADGVRFTLSKGLCNKVLITGEDGGALTWECENAREIQAEMEEVDADFGKKGYKTIAVAAKRGEDGPWQFCGIVPMLDPPREDTAGTIAALHDAGIRVKMITGDHLNIAKETASMIGLGTDIHHCKEIAIPTFSTKVLIDKADGFAVALPKDKLEIVATLQSKGDVIGMTGDGVNDAPALAQAQIGIAVEGATDAARAAADIVLTAPGLSPIYTAVVESRKIFRRIKTYIVYRMASTVQLVCFLCYLIFAFHVPMNPTYVILLAVLNDIATLTLAFDHAIPSKNPEIPTLWGLIMTSGMYGIVLLAEGIIFYEEMPQILGDDEYVVGDYGPGQGASYLQLALSMLLLIFSTRTNKFALLDWPAVGLFSSVSLGCVFSILFAGLGAVDLVGWREVGIIIGYDLLWFIGMDLAKVIMYRFLTDEEILVVRNNLGKGFGPMPATEGLIKPKEAALLEGAGATVRPSVASIVARSDVGVQPSMISRTLSARGSRSYSIEGAMPGGTATRGGVSTPIRQRINNRTPGGISGVLHPTHSMENW